MPSAPRPPATLSSAEAQALRAVELADLGLVVIDPDGQVVWASSAALRKLGLGDVAVEDRCLRDLLPPLETESGDLVPPQAVAIELTRRTGEPCDQVLSRVAPDGRRVWLRLRTVPGEEPGAVVLTVRDITGPYMDRRAAWQRVEQAHRLLHEVSDVLIRQEPDGTVVEVVGPTERFFGLQREEIIGARVDVRTYVHPEDRPAMEEAAAALLRTGEARITWRTAPHLGPTRWFRSRSRAVIDLRSGSVVEYVSAIADVTEQHAAEQALAEREEHLRRLVNGLPGSAIIVFDRELRIVSVDGGALQHVGTDGSELVGRRLFEIDREADDLEPFFRAALEGRQSQTIAPWRGSEFLVRWAPLGPERDGRYEQGFLVAQDVTDLVRVNRELVESERRFSAGFDRSPVASLLGTPDGVITRANSALLLLIGRSPAEVVGRSWTELVTADSRPVGERMIGQLVSGVADSVVFEQRLLHSSGAELQVEVSLAVVRDADGSALQLLAHLVDLTGQRALEERLRYLADHDVLTDLLNRRGFTHAVEEHLARTERYGATGALLLVDLDRFKYINDEFGHPAGDALLAAVADALRHRLRRSDVVARLGGDEFAVLLPQGGEKEATSAAEAIHAALAEVKAPDGDPVRASIGIGLVGEGSLDPDRVLIAADAALYRAKADGKACTRVAVSE